MFLQLNTQAGYGEIVFFGLFDLLIGYLIFRSTFLPRILGVLMAIAGLGWLIFLSPPLASHLSLYIEVLGFVAELLLMLWLLVFGVNDQRWEGAGRRSGDILPHLKAAQARICSPLPRAGLSRPRTEPPASRRRML